MIVILSYYSDGSSEPRIEFVLDGPHQHRRVIEIMQRVSTYQKCVQVYEIEALDRTPTQIDESLKVDESAPGFGL